MSVGTATEKFKAAEAEILARLDIAAEAEALGIEFTSDRVNTGGWRECRSIDRDDRNPSSAVNVGSTNGLRGKYCDLGSEGNAISFWDLRAKRVGGTWEEARKYYADQAGVKLPGHAKRFDPAYQFDPMPWSTPLARMFEASKAGVFEAELLACGAHMGRHQQATVIGLPVLGPTLDASKPIGRVMAHATGGMLWAGKGKDRKQVRIKTSLNSVAGFIGSHCERLSKLSGNLTVIKTEGPWDKLALQHIIPEDRRGEFLVFTNSGGCAEDPKWMAEPLARFSCIVVPDPDAPGEAGGRKWAQAIANGQGEQHTTRLVKMPVPGQDLRDWIVAGHTFDDFLALVEQAEVIESKAMPEPITNYIETKTTKDTGEEKVEVEPKRMTDIIKQVTDCNDGQPYRVGNVLFVDDSAHGLHWFDQQKVPGLMGWLRSRHVVSWKAGSDFVAKTELFAELERIAKRFDAIELHPHEPPIAGVYYRTKPPAPGDGATLEKLLDRFRPETAGDRELIKSVILTLFWGGPPGTRPAFVFTSDAGRGAGKTKAAELLALIAGGHLDVSTNEDIATLKARMLSAEGQAKRVNFLDNVKSSRLSWAEAESLITSPTISGKRMYVGEQQRPNYVTWLLTVNGVALATDMSQRSVIIKLSKGDNSGAWYEETVRMIETQREAIIADVIGVLRLPSRPMQKHSRWATWEAAVLSKLPDPDALQKLILERQTESDCEQDESDVIEEFFGEQLRKLAYNINTQVIHIPSQVAARWYGWAVGEQMKTVAASRRLSQASREGKLHHIRPNAGHAKGRGFEWIGEHANFNSTNTCYDLEHRIADEARRRSEAT